jgi:hypothetical protein
MHSVRVPADARGEYFVEVTFDSGPLMRMQQARRRIAVH